MQSFAFFWTQLFTWGNSDLSDFQLIYMTDFEAGLYFIIEWLFLWIQVPAAGAWVLWWWWAYAVLGMYEASQFLLKLETRDDKP